MTTVIAIKCKDGIVIARDSQGTSNTIKLKSKKIYGINKFIGLGGAGDSSQIKYVVKFCKQIVDLTHDHSINTIMIK